MELLGRYEVRGELGRGGMGVVYRAYDPTLDREVAIKSVRLEGVNESERARGEERLSREARAAAQLRHRNIVAVYDFFRIEDRAYIVMEYVRGAMLEAMILAGERQDLARIGKVLRQAALALDEAHAQGMAHGCVKPGNMLLDELGNVKITDFGIARRMGSGGGETQAGPGTMIRTLGYMAPEQIRGEAVDGRADQFSLGVVAYQMYTGEMPFQADSWIALSHKIIHDQPTPASTFNPKVSARMQAAIERMTAKQPLERFPRCIDFVEGLGSTTEAGSVESMSLGKKAAILVPIALVVMGIVFGMITRTGNRVTEGIDGPVAWTPPPAAKQAETQASLAAPPTTAPTVAISLSFVVDGWPMEFALIPAGRFSMGSETEIQNQKPRHMVKISKAFQMGRTEVSEKQWNAVMTGKATGSNLPKATVSWNEVQEFLAKLNAAKDGFRYRLPTEAEWEYAARGGSQEDRPRHLEDMAWLQQNGGQRPHEVATRIANAFGLYDTLGNVSEWTSDWLDAGYYATSPGVDPEGPKTGTMRMVRGGNYDTEGVNISMSRRFAGDPVAKLPEIGFRVVRVQQ